MTDNSSCELDPTWPKWWATIAPPVLRRAVHEAAHVAAAATYGVPVVSVTIGADNPHLERGRYRPHSRRLGVEALAILCLAGGAAEEMIFGSADGGDRIDVEMASPFLLGVYTKSQLQREMNRARAGARRLVRTPMIRR
jgi:hypothetical protein